MDKDKATTTKPDGAAAAASTDGAGKETGKDSLNKVTILHHSLITETVVFW